MLLTIVAEGKIDHAAVASKYLISDQSFKRYVTTLREVLSSLYDGVNLQYSRRENAYFLLKDGKILSLCSRMSLFKL